MRIDCVGAIVHDDGRLLLVRRANPPAAGTWTIPGGKVEAGEDDATAVVREVAEETGLVVEVGRLVGQVERDAPGGAVFVIRDYECRLAQGSGADAVAADDADAVTWVDLDGLGRLPLAPLLRETLEEWGVLPTA
ncbi:MAG TPA: NUDIX domain-containing protein [Actinomycetales bacterium]|nr:NUDIX domain-containing protein [Actinomycetales bacterium]